MMSRSAIIIRSVAMIEMAIGLTTFIGTIGAVLIGASQKPINILVFVLVSSVISTMIGFGLLYRHNQARRALLFFAGFVVLTKILALMGIIKFNGEILTMPPTDIKNIISFIYHASVILFLEQKTSKALFGVK